MGFLSKLNKSLGFSKGTKERARALKRREALGLTPKYVEDPMGRILSPRGRFNQSALERRVAEMTALNPGMGLGQSEAPSMPRRGGPRRGDMGMPRMPRIDDGRMRAMPIRNEDGTIMSSRLKMPQSIPEQMPTDPSSYYNPTIFGQQMGDMDFSQMPEISPVDMSNLQMPTLPREISQMDLPQMPEGLPSMQDVQGMPQMGMRGMRDMQPRQMMAEGDEVFPDLTGDGQVTQADILKGRGVYAEGDEVMMMQGNEIESMLSGMESPMGEEEAMAELEQVQPEMEMIEQLVMMVAQMIQQGAGEEEVIGFLREQGLDDEDIGTVLQLVTEMSETEEMAEDQIGNELAQLG